MFPWLPWVWKGVGGEYISPCGPLLVLSSLSCPSCLSACIEVFWPGGPGLPLLTKRYRCIVLLW